MGIGGRRSNREKKGVNPCHVAVPHCAVIPTGVRASELSADKGEDGRDCSCSAELPLTGVKRIIEADTGRSSLPAGFVFPSRGVWNTHSDSHRCSPSRGVSDSRRCSPSLSSGSCLHVAQDFQQWKTINDPRRGAGRLGDGKVHVIDARDRIRKTIMGVGRSEEATMDQARYYNEVRSHNEAHALPLPRRRLSFDPPRSPVDSISLPFLSNVCTRNLPSSGLRLGNDDLPQAIPRAAPPSLLGLACLSHPFAPLRRLPTSVVW